MKFDGSGSNLSTRFASYPHIASRMAGRPAEGEADAGSGYNLLMPDRAVLTVPGLERVEFSLGSLTAKLTAIEDRQTKIEATLAELRDFVVGQRSVKDWYSPEEVAEILRKQPYTVREWCRYLRINARKRPTGRGDAREWEISRDEVERIKCHGLLPVPSKY
jgi:hypothetical protein